MFNYSLLIFLVFPLVQRMLDKLIHSRIVVLAAHILMTTSLALYIVLRYKMELIMQAMNVEFLLCVGFIIIGFLIYMVDLLIKNILLNDLLILDIKFYTSFNNISILRLILSLIISIGEEFIFRFPISQLEFVKGGLLFMLGSISFGIIHFYFSKYDGLSKIVIGLIFGMIVLITKNIYYSIIVHITYNIAIELFGGVNTRRNRDDV